MNIRYAVSTMVFWWREHPLSLEQECEYLKSLGFGIELWPTLRGQNECRYGRRNWQRLQNATEGMLVSMRSRMDGPTLEQWAEQIECAKLLDANIVADLESLGILHGPDLRGTNLAGEIVNMAQAQGVPLCVETGSLATMISVGQRFESIGFCLDVGHANIDPECSFRQYIDELAPRVVHLHLTDNYGQRDDHEPPGLNGGISRSDWDYLLTSLDRYDNEVIGSFEMSPCMPNVMIRRANEFVFDVMKWPNRPQRHSRDACLAYHPL